MFTLSDADEIKAKRLCFRCTKEEYLLNEIKIQGKRAKCDYCGKTRRCYSLEKFSELIEHAFADHYERTSNRPTHYEEMMSRDREFDYEWYRKGEPTAIAIMIAAKISETAAKD